jgi:hypothetical protein
LQISPGKGVEAKGILEQILNHVVPGTTQLVPTRNKSSGWRIMVKEKENRI